MTSRIALLRGINVGGKTLVPMADLRKLFESLGFSGVQTLLQSGNVVFKSQVSPATKLEITLEEAIAEKFSHPVDCIIRTGEEWQALIETNPFPGEMKDDPSHLLVMCLKDAPSADAMPALRAAITGREYFQLKKTNLYLVYPDGIGRSKLTNILIEKKLGTRGTARNWNTVLKIAEALEG